VYQAYKDQDHDGMRGGHIEESSRMVCNKCARSSNYTHVLLPYLNFEKKIARFMLIYKAWHD